MLLEPGEDVANKSFTVIKQINHDAVEQFGARRARVWGAVASEFSETYLFGSLLLPDQNDFSTDEESDAMAWYWNDVFQPAYEELSQYHKELFSREVSGENVDSWALSVEKWFEIYAEYVKPRESEAKARCKSIHDAQRELWMKTLHANKGEYGFDDEDIKKVESEINELFDSSVEGWVNTIVGEEQSRFGALSMLEYERDRMS